VYLPSHFREERTEVLHSVIRACPLATLVVAHGAGFEVNHVPCLLREGPDGAPAIHAHVSRANPLAKLAGAGVPAVAVFTASEGYVSPSWYPAKAEHGRVVPTWNYIVVHAHGSLRAIDDVAWLRGQVEALTRAHEGAREHPWAVSDAPEDYVASQLQGIIGLELAIARLEGKWKLSQNRALTDRIGVAEGLESEPGEGPATLARRVRDALP
jgi:transcriptional regulator